MCYIKMSDMDMDICDKCKYCIREIVIDGCDVPIPFEVVAHTCTLKLPMVIMKSCIFYEEEVEGRCLQ